MSKVRLLLNRPKLFKLIKVGFAYARGNGDRTYYFEIKQPIKVWKKVYREDTFWREVISLTLIPGSIIAVPSWTNKCRATCAFVNEGTRHYVSTYDSHFRYKANTLVFPRQQFEYSTITECGPGIHFFFTEAEAERY